MDDRNLVPNAGDITNHSMKPVQGVAGIAPSGQTVDNQDPKGIPPMGNTDEWAGKPIDANYGFVPQDKEAVNANLKKVEADIQERFGLQSRGMEDTHEYPKKP